MKHLVFFCLGMLVFAWPLTGGVALSCAAQDASDKANVAQPAQQTSRADVFDALWTTVRDDFYDPEFNGANWEHLGQKYRDAAIAAADEDEFARIVNEMLSELRTSHTHYFTRNDPRYYQILGIFNKAPDLQPVIERLVADRPDAQLSYDGIGIETISTDEGVFVSCVYEGLPAHQAGLLVGDRLVSVNGAPFHPVLSFQGKANVELTFKVQRQGGSSMQEIDIAPQAIDPQQMFLNSMRASVRIIEDGERRIGYVHVLSYAGEQYQDLLREELLSGRLADADALVLDLRDGWGGASPEYLNLFNSQIPAMTMKSRDSEPQEFPTVWRKPTALLINDGVRSGKEVFALGFKQMKRGPVVGTRTAGAVVGGSPRVMPDDSVLYLAVVDAEVNGKRLEGVGVEPTIQVERPIPFSAGKDPQLDAAIEALRAEVIDALRAEIIAAQRAGIDSSSMKKSP